MKKLIGCLFTLSCILLYSSCVNKNASNKADIIPSSYSAQITLVDSVYDFGKIKLRDEPYSYSFNLKNNGKVPAVILHTIPSCKCTKVEYNKSPIPVGKSDSIHVYFDSEKSGKGYFEKIVKIRINSPKSYTLKIRGVVE